MDRFKKILCYVGDDVDPQPALQRAGELARANGAVLTLIDVLPESPVGPWLVVPGQARLGHLLTLEKDRELKALAADVAASGLRVKTLLPTGRPFVELIREVLRGGHDLVIKSAEEHEGGLFGSTGLHLMRKCPCPVWVVKSSDARNCGRVLAAVDPDPQGNEENGLNVAILQLASTLAERSKSSLKVLHALWLPYESELSGPRASALKENLKNYRGTAHRLAYTQIEGLMAKCGTLTIKPQLRVEHGRPSDVLVNSANRADLTVMGTLSRTGVAGVFIGNTAERVLQRITSSVLTIKPPGFETPIQLDPGRTELRSLEALQE